MGIPQRCAAPGLRYYDTYLIFCLSRYNEAINCHQFCKNPNMHTTRSRPDNITMGSLLFLFSYFNIAVMGAVVKSLPDTVTVGAIIFFQFSIPLLLSLPKILRKGVRCLRTDFYHVHLLRDISGVFTFTAFFFALSFISLTNAIVLRSTTPFWIPIILFIWQRKHITKQLWLAIFAGFIGITLMVKPDLNGYFNIGSLLALASGFFIAISTLIIRELSSTEPTERSLFYYCLFATIVSFPFVNHGWMQWDAATWSLLISVGVLMYLIENTFIVALSYEKASTLAPISYSAIIFSAIFDWLIWGKNFDRYDCLGAIFIVSAGLLSVRNERRPQPA